MFYNGTVDDFLQKFDMETIQNLIIVEGNISAGKSTLCKQLANALNFKLFLEPAAEGNPYLALFYQDMKKYALKMQLWLLRRRFETIVEAIRIISSPTSETKGVLLDRSLFSDFVFAMKNYEDGNISQQGFDYYLQLRSQLLEKLPIPQITLYLDVSPSVCHYRIHKVRSRDCETGIELSYLQGLDCYYKQLLTQMKQLGSQVLVVDWNEFGNYDQITNTIQQLLNKSNKEIPQQLVHFVNNQKAIRDAMVAKGAKIPAELGGEDKDEHTQAYKISEKCLFIETIILPHNAVAIQSM